MKKVLFLICILLVSCIKKDPPNLDPVGIEWKTGPITANTILSDTTYFEGIIRVANGVKLTILPGSVVIFNHAVPSALVIEQGAKIEAKGTAQNPITFTSDQESEGAWGGIIILGRATVLTDNVNLPVDTDKIEGFQYGGNLDTDNSGTLNYVRILFAGGVSANNIEQVSVFNGLTLCGVGTSTHIEYVQVHKSGRDAFAIFGGMVNLRHIIATSSKDEGLYSDESWRGNVQFYIAQMTNGTVGNGIEITNNRNSAFNGPWLDESNSCFPFRGPDFCNVTIIGDDRDHNMENHGVLIAPGGHGSFVNTIILGFEKGKPISVEEPNGWTTYYFFHYLQVQLLNYQNSNIDDPDTDEDEQTWALGYYGDSSSYQIQNPFSKDAPDFSAVQPIPGFELQLNQMCPDSFWIRGETGSINFKGAVGNKASNNPATRDWSLGWTTYP